MSISFLPKACFVTYPEDEVTEESFNKIRARQNASLLQFGDKLLPAKSILRGVLEEHR